MYSGRFQVFLTYFLVITEKFLTFFFEVISHFSLISRLFYWFSKFQAQLYFAVISHFSVTLLSYFSVTVWINFVVLALIVGEIVSVSGVLLWWMDTRGVKPWQLASKLFWFFISGMQSVEPAHFCARISCQACGWKSNLASSVYLGFQSP